MSQTILQEFWFINIVKKYLSYKSQMTEDKEKDFLFHGFQI